jgi:hypothetical protein
MFRASSYPSSGATTTAVAVSGLPSERGDRSAVGRGWAGQPNPDQQHCYHQAPTVNQRLLLQLLWLLMMGMRMPKTCWAVSKRQVINLRGYCILLVDSVESTMMHGLANPKFKHRLLTTLSNSLSVAKVYKQWLTFLVAVIPCQLENYSKAKL